MPQNTLHQSPTAIALLLRATRRYGDLPAFEWADGAITYRDIELFMGRAQSVLAREALAVGDTIATLSRNGAEDWLLARAAQGLGLCVLALHPMGSLQDHLKYMTAAGVRCLLVDGHGYAERGAELAAARPDVRVLSIGAAGFADDILAAIQAEAPVAVRDISQPDAVAGRHFTGGTTGEPKQIVITHRGFTAGIHAFRANVELPSVPRVVAAGPVSHVTGTLIMPTLLRGGSIYMLPGFDPAALIRAIAARHINTTLMVPTMIYSLLDSPALAEADLSSLQAGARRRARAEGRALRPAIAADRVWQGRQKGVARPDPGVSAYLSRLRFSAARTRKIWETSGSQRPAVWHG